MRESVRSCSPKEFNFEAILSGLAHFNNEPILAGKKLMTKASGCMLACKLHWTDQKHSTALSVPNKPKALYDTLQLETCKETFFRSMSMFLAIAFAYQERWECKKERRSPFSSISRTSITCNKKDAVNKAGEDEE